MTNKVWVEVPPEKGSCCLLLKGSQMVVVNKDVAVESVSLVGGGGFVRCHYSNQNLGISTANGKEETKFRLRFAPSPGKTAVDNCLEAVGQLKKFVSVVEHPSHKGRKLVQPLESKPIQQVLKELLDTDASPLGNSVLVLPEENISQIVQECLIDPGFSALASKVEELLENQTAVDT